MMKVFTNEIKNGVVPITMTTYPDICVRDHTAKDREKWIIGHSKEFIKGGELSAASEDCSQERARNRH